MVNKYLDGMKEIPDVRLDMTEEDCEKIDAKAQKLLPLSHIEKISAEAMAVIDSWDLKAMTEITITKIGIVPNTPPDARFEGIPGDIPKGELFASGTIKAPIPICTKDGLRWIRLNFSFSFYRSSRQAKAKIIFSPSPNPGTENFLNPDTNRVSHREKAFEKMLTRYYKDQISIETFSGMKERVEAIYLQRVTDAVQKMIDAGEFSDIVGAVENDRNLFAGSDLKIDQVLGSLDDKLADTLKKSSGSICVPSYQSWAGSEAEKGWLRLCNLASYSKDYMTREIDFLKLHGDRISEAVGDADDIMFFGIGNFEKESLLIKKLLETRGDKAITVHGIDVGTDFHLCAFKGMAEIRKETGNPVKYRGHIALFSNAPEIAEDINKKHPGNEPKIMRICLGNTFGNFTKDEDPWNDLAGNMKPGEKLLISADIVQKQDDPDIRQTTIDNILARYQSREWREWVLNPLYRAFGQSHRWLVSPDNVTVQWDDAAHGIVFTYRFPETADNGKGMGFAKDEVIELHRTRKIDPERLAMEAQRNGFRITEQFLNENGNFGYYLLEKVR